MLAVLVQDVDVADFDRVHISFHILDFALPPMQ
jgi:hypothetical protein